MENLQDLFREHDFNNHGMIQISVKDSGIGIKQDDQQQLFKLFGFLDSSKAMNTKGVGLGLHISKMIAKQLGGDCSVKSQWGKGSTFSFVLALHQKSSSEMSVQRIFNPIKKNYQKIIINKRDFKGSQKTISKQQELNDKIRTQI